MPEINNWMYLSCTELNNTQQIKKRSFKSLLILKVKFSSVLYELKVTTLELRVVAHAT